VGGSRKGPLRFRGEEGRVYGAGAPTLGSLALTESAPAGVSLGSRRRPPASLRPLRHNLPPPCAPLPAGLARAFAGLAPSPRTVQVRPRAVFAREFVGHPSPRRGQVGSRAVFAWELVGLLLAKNGHVGHAQFSRGKVVGLPLCEEWLGGATRSSAVRWLPFAKNEWGRVTGRWSNRGWPAARALGFWSAGSSDGDRECSSLMGR
jgi:hypothetical protein